MGLKDEINDILKNKKTNKEIRSIVDNQIKKRINVKALKDYKIIKESILEEIKKGKTCIQEEGYLSDLSDICYGKLDKPNCYYFGIDFYLSKEDKISMQLNNIRYPEVQLFTKFNGYYHSEDLYIKILELKIVRGFFSKTKVEIIPTNYFTLYKEELNKLCTQDDIIINFESVIFNNGRNMVYFDSSQKEIHFIRCDDSKDYIKIKYSFKVN